MFCRKCGKQISDDSNICRYCGTPVTIRPQGVPPTQGVSPIQKEPSQGKKKSKAVIFVMIAALIAVAVIIAVLLLPKLKNGMDTSTNSSVSQGTLSSRISASSSGDSRQTSSATSKEANSGKSSSASSVSENAGATVQNLELKLPSPLIKTYHVGGEWTITKIDYSIEDTIAGPLVIVKINAVCDATSYPQDNFIIYYELYEEGKDDPVVPSTVFVGGKGTATTTVNDEIRIGNLQRGKTYRFNISEASLMPTAEPPKAEQQQTGNNAVDYILPTSNSEYLDRAVIALLSDEDLRLARNEIYARHGRKFTAEDLQAYFNSKTWYRPTIEAADFDTNGGGLLNDFEKVNLMTIQQVEADREQKR